MTNVYFKNGKFDRAEGSETGNITWLNNTLNLNYGDFLLFGNIDGLKIDVRSASLDAKNAKIIDKNLHFTLHKSEVENLDNGNIWLWENSSISNSSVNQLFIKRDAIVDSIVSARVVNIDANSTLSIAKNGVLKVPDKNALDFSKINGEGKIYGQKQHAYYDTNNKLLEYNKNIDLFALNADDGNETFSFDGTKLVLNKGYDFILSGDKSVFIVNNGVILKAEISGANLMSISGSGSIKELHLSNNARFSLNSDFEKAVIDKGSILTFFKPVDFSKLSGDGYVNINGAIYDTSGHALNNANSSLVASIKEHNFAVTKAIEKEKELKATYINTDKQNTDVALLNIEMINNDNFL